MSTTNLTAQMRSEALMERIQWERNLKQYQLNEEFRDFIVWLCGFTDRQHAPDQEEWQELQEKSKKIAAQYALRVREHRKQQRNLTLQSQSLEYSYDMPEQLELDFTTK